jgi:hypothetical protein
MDYRLHNDLSEDGSPKPVVNRPAALALLFERIALQGRASRVICTTLLAVKAYKLVLRFAGRRHVR